jgi:hypothetical protein
VDAVAAGLRDVSQSAARAGVDNLVYVRAAVEELPAELAGVADRVTIVLPWGSLLAAVARPDVAILDRIRRICAPGATVTVLLSVDTLRDAAEARRLGLPVLDDAHVDGPLRAGYADAGFALSSVQAMDTEQLLAGWPSTWARRLRHGRPRTMLRIDAGRVRSQG